MDQISKEIKNFLSFLNNCSEQNRIQDEIESDMDMATQDIMHDIEFHELDQYNLILRGITLQDIRRKRRAAKDIVAVTEPVKNWIAKNKKVIHDLETVLGEVRKEEGRIENRMYTECIQKERTF